MNYIWMVEQDHIKLAKLHLHIRIFAYLHIKIICTSEVINLPITLQFSRIQKQPNRFHSLLLHPAFN